MALYSTFLRTSSCLIVLSLLTACGADEHQDKTLSINGQMPLAPQAVEQAQSNDSSVVLTGVAIDEYLANALVWVDLRENDSLDGFEPFAYTDSEGYFSYNPNTGVNYCKANETFLQQYCLKTGLQTGEVVIKAAQGIKTTSGTNNIGILTTSVSLDDAKANLQNLLSLGARPLGASEQFQSELDQSMIKLSPLSSLAHQLPASMSLQTAFARLGFDLSEYPSDDAILQADYMATMQSQGVNGAMVHPILSIAASNLSAIVTIITSNSDKALASFELGEGGLPISSADSIYSGIANALVNQGDTQSPRTLNSALLGDGDVNTSSNKQKQNQSGSQLILNDVLRATLEHLALQFANNSEQTQDAWFTMIQSQMEPVLRDDTLQAILQNVQTAQKVFIEQLQSDGQVQILLSKHEFNALLNMVAINIAISQNIAFSDPSTKQRVLKITEQFTALDNPVNAAILAALSANIRPNINEIVTQLREAEQNDKLQTLDADDITITPTQNLATDQGSSFWGSKRLSLSGRLNDYEQGQVIAFFTDSDQITAGDVVVCIAYENKLNPSDNITGKRMTGFWSTLSETEQNPVSIVVGSRITLKVNGESFGRDIPSDQSLVNLTRNPNELYGQFLFSLDQDSETWHSDDTSINTNYGIVDYAEVPQNDESCQAMLNLQVD